VDSSERLIESARELLWERGYVGMSPRAVQRRAGAGQGSMYHHFSGKQDLAAAALRRSAAELREQAERTLSGPGGACERVAAYLLHERDALRGCRVGRMAQDPEVIAAPALREPVAETFAWLRARLAEVLREGAASGQLPGSLDPDDTAAALAAVLQGGYVLARAEGGAEPYERAVRGALALLTAQARPAATP